MTDQISRALEGAAARQPFVPDVGETVRRGRKRRARRQRTAIAGAVLGFGAIAAAVTIALPEHHGQTATVGPAPTQSAATPSAASTAAPVRIPADPDLVTRVTTLSPTLFAAVGAPALPNGIKKVSGQPLVFDGKPGVFWDGAEYCPFCASERWPLVVALSRFGTWSGLSTTTSATEDVYPDTATFSFYGATYSSRYLSFQSVETETNRRVGSGFAPLQTPTAPQAALVEQYDHGGSIPFIDFGSTFTSIGASYDPSILMGKSTSQIAEAIADPSTEIGKTVLGTANWMTAAICRITENQPGDVCNSSAITSLNAMLTAAPSS